MAMSAGKPRSTDAPALMITMAALLEQGHRLDALSRLLTAGAIILLLLLAMFAPAMPSGPSALAGGGLVLAILLGLIELYFAFRVGFDAALFRELAAGKALTGLGPLDASLAGLGLRRETAGSRTLEDRIRGARMLLRRQTLCLALQLVTMVVTAGLLALQ
jgi:hypothetical protein